MDAGLLRPADPLLAAHHFTWLVISVPWNKALFCASDVTFIPAELNHYADAGVEAFLAAYSRADRPRRRVLQLCR